MTIPNVVQKVILTKITHSCVYFIRRGRQAVIKIGISSNPLHRLSSLQTAADVPLSLIGFIPCLSARAKDLERRLHAHFKDKHRHGEWFSLSLKELLAGLEEMGIEEALINVAEIRKTLALDEPLNRRLITQQDLDRIAQLGINLEVLYRRAGLNTATMRSKRRQGKRRLDPSHGDSQALLEALRGLRDDLTLFLRKSKLK